MGLPPKDKTLKERKSAQYALPFTIETLVGVTMKLNMFGLAFCVMWSIMVLYMSSSFWLLGNESRDFSHAEKERTATCWVNS